MTHLQHLITDFEYYVQFGMNCQEGSIIQGYYFSLCDNLINVISTCPHGLVQLEESAKYQQYKKLKGLD